MKRLTMVGIVVLTLAALVLVPASCSSASKVVPSMPTIPATPPAPTIAVNKGASALPSTPSIPATNEERMIVRTGEMSLVVADVIKARDEIAQLAATLDGYVVSSQIWGQEQDMRGSISIRVPDDKFEPTLSELTSLAVRVTSESTNSQDITEEYVDLQSRLKNAEAAEAQYLDLLQKASDVQDILSIYQQLTQVRSEIEQIKGRMQYLERTSSMSLISASLTPVASSKPLVRTGWTLIEAFKSAIRGAVIVGQLLVTIVIWLVISSPLWGVIIGVIYWRRRRKGAKA